MVLRDSLTGSAMPTFGVYPNLVAGRHANMRLNNISKGIFTVNIISAADVLVKQLTLRHKGGNTDYASALAYAKSVYLTLLSDTKQVYC